MSPPQLRGSEEAAFSVQGASASGWRARGDAAQRPEPLLTKFGGPRRPDGGAGASKVHGSLSPPARGEHVGATLRRSSGRDEVQGDRRRWRLPEKNGSVDASEASTPRRAAHAAHIPSARTP